MKIRKKETSIGIVGKILNAFSSSKQDTYSADYINADEFTIDNSTTLGEGSKTLTNKYNKIDVVCAVNTANTSIRTIIPVYNGFQTGIPCIVYIDGYIYLALRTFELNDKVLSWSTCTCYGIKGHNSTLNDQNTCEKPLKAICYYKQD